MKIELVDRSDAFNFHKRQVLRMDDGGRLRPYRWWARAWDRLWSFRHRVDFHEVTAIDQERGAITMALVRGRWSWLRWKWVPDK